MGTLNFKAQKISKNVFWVGAIDWTVRNFHGYETSSGTTYNAYLILADKITLVDTVKASFKDEMLARIATVIDPDKIEYLVSNHAELDHSGSIPAVVSELNISKVFASPNGVKALNDHFHSDMKLNVVKSGDELDLGNMKLKFEETRMVHWPDSMFSYLEKDKLLFSQDAFGMHLASSERFVDEFDSDIIYKEASKYYANILLPLGVPVASRLGSVAKLNWQFEIIAPDHGPIWRKNTDTIIQNYQKWVKQEPVKKAVIVYDTMWSSTGLMARSITDGLMQEGIKVVVMSMTGSHRSNVATELLAAGALIVGSPTLNNNMFPTIADILSYIKGLKPRNLITASFGSYGWSGEAADQIADYMQSMKLDFFGEPLKVKYVPDSAALFECQSFGKNISKRIKELCDLKQ